MREIDGRCDTWALVKLAGIIPEVRVVDEPPQIAFEMAYIDGIETGRCLPTCRTSDRSSGHRREAPSEQLQGGLSKTEAVAQNRFKSYRFEIAKFRRSKPAVENIAPIT